MLAVVPLVSALVLLEGCYALGGLRYIHPPTAHGLAARTQLESFDNVANWSNTTTAQNSAIVPVVLADDGQYVPCSSLPCCFHFARTFPPLFSFAQDVLFRHRGRPGELPRLAGHWFGGLVRDLVGLLVLGVLRAAVLARVQEFHVPLGQQQPDGVQCQLCGRNMYVQCLLRPGRDQSDTLRIAASGFVGMETFQVGNLSVPAQMFGMWTEHF